MSASAEVALEQGTIIRGKRLTYVVDEELPGATCSNRFAVLTPQYGRSVMRVEKITEADRLLRLNNELALLMAAENAPPEHRLHLVRLIDFGVTADWKYITTSRVGPSLEDLQYKFGVPFGPRTVRHIAAETLAAIREVHELGYLLRNVRPNDFNIGPSPFGEKSICIGTYNRVFNFMGANNQPKRPRAHVAYPYAPLYASRARLKEKDCTIRDDYESWLYMVFDFYDQRWIRAEQGREKEERVAEILKQKEAMFSGEFLPHMWERIPDSLKDALDVVGKTKWARVPDRDRIDSIIKQLLPVERGSSWWKLDWEGAQEIDMMTSVMRPPTIAGGCNLLAYFPDQSDPLCKQRWDSGATLNGNDVSKRKPVTISSSPDNTSKRLQKEHLEAQQQKEQQGKTTDNLVRTSAEASKWEKTKDKKEDAQRTEYDVEVTCAGDSESYSPNKTQAGTPLKDHHREEKVLRGFDANGDRAELRLSASDRSEKKAE